LKENFPKNIVALPVHAVMETTGKLLFILYEETTVKKVF
jgi:hypothetical protein